MLQIPFYQSEWNTIDLKALADELGMPDNTLPTAEFYERYYQRLNEHPDLISDRWKKGKQDQSAWLRKTLDAYGGKSVKSISIGAGLGLIEQALIEEGYDTELYDFQSSSFEHLAMQDKTRCHSGSWDGLSDNAYDIVFTMATTYAFDDKTLQDFASMSQRILKPRGTLVIIDTSIHWQEIYAQIRNAGRYKREKVLWGYKRSIPVWKKIFKNFNFLGFRYYKKGLEEIKVKTFMGIPYGQAPHRQSIILQKKDET